MAHDYAPNNDYFNKYVKNKVWDWLEIQDADIEGSVLANGLLPFIDAAGKLLVKRAISNSRKNKNV